MGLKNSKEEDKKGRLGNTRRRHAPRRHLRNIPSTSVPRKKEQPRPSRAIQQWLKGDARALDARGLGSKTIVKNAKSNKLIVLAIDFGTTFSGYAFSWLDKKDAIYTHNLEKTSIKTPTIVLLDQSKKFHSFGMEAKSHYLDLVKEGTHMQWYYFENFKMKLFVQEGPLDKNMMLADMFDKEVLAIEVFSAAIEYMKKHFLEKLHGENDEKIITEKDILFILTVPAIWSDLSKQFMRQAAMMAGIPDESLSLALEPEAASLYCKEHFKGIHVVPGTKFIVADLGGGTVDFTCHEVNKNLTLRELQKPSGGDYGGTTVDTAFRDILNKLFGADVLQRFKVHHMKKYCELFDHFQLKKKIFEGKDRIVLQFPLSLLQIYEDNVGESVIDTLRSSPYVGRIEFKNDKMIISKELAKDIFDTAVQKIVDKTSELLNLENNVEAIVMVGGFSESPYLQEAMKAQFDQRKSDNGKVTLRVLSPQEPASAVIKGAVMFGYQPRAIDSRICKYSYGIARMMIFKPFHKEEKRIEINGVSWCNDLFNKHIEVGQTVRVDDNFQAEEYFPVTDDMTQGVLEVYATPERNPTYIDEPGCQLVGFIRIDLTGGDVEAKVLVKLIFGGTELRVEAVEEKTERFTVGHVDFLG